MTVTADVAQQTERDASRIKLRAKALAVAISDLGDELEGQRMVQMMRGQQAATASLDQAIAKLASIRAGVEDLSIELAVTFAVSAR